MAYTTNETGMDQEMPNLENKSLEEFNTKITEIACQQLYTSSAFKEPLIERWRKYQDLYNGRVKKKLRVQFNVALPVFSGMLDTLLADFDEPIQIKFEEDHPSDYFKVRKQQAAWDQEKQSLDVESMWDYKSRVDKKNAIFSGRGILKYYAYSDPEYKSCLDVVSYEKFHCQPQGGGILENHLFAGTEDIIRTESEIEDNVKAGLYNAKQFDLLKERAGNKDYVKTLSNEYQSLLSRFQSRGLQPDSHNYVGESTHNLCEWVLTYRGKRYYVLFEPWTKTWLRVEPLLDIQSTGVYPWTSWATHEDNEVFWSKSFADDLFPIAESIITMFNQELTNREKRNLGARAYDKDMFPDVAKLDSAQYRADALIPADTKGGTRKISEGIYFFETPELKGTIDTIDWLKDFTGRETGVTDISQGSGQDKQKRVGVVYQEQNNVAKRIGHKSQSWTQAWGEVGLRYIQGLKDHMPESIAIKRLGDLGFEWDTLIKSDLNLIKPPRVKIISTSYEQQEANNKKDARMKGWELLDGSPNINPEMRDASILRDLMLYSEDEIKLIMDKNNYASRESIAKAHESIQLLLKDVTPDIFYNADTAFLKIINDYSMEHRNKLGKERFAKFQKYLLDHAMIVKDNMNRLAGLAGASTPPTAVNKTATPNPSPLQVPNSTAAPTAPNQ